ncbi:MAG: peroxiredoxin-like family protein [Bacteroidota bacterium]
MKKFSLIIGVFALMASTAMAQLPTSAQEVCPLKISSTVPEEAMLTSLEGEEMLLTEVLAEKPTVLVFYRGGWCPFCNRHLAELQETLSPLQELGYQVVAVSADSYEKLSETSEKNELKYKLYSGADLSAFTAFGIGYQLDDKTAEKYKGYGIDLSASEGVLPVPSVFVFNKKGAVVFSHVDPNYKERLNAKVLLAVAEANK